MELRRELFLKEDVIEEYDIRIGDVPPPAPLFSKAVHYIRTLIPRIQIAYKVEDIKSKTSQELRSSTSGENQRNSSHHHLSYLQEEIVGLVGPTEELRRWLKEGGEERTVITVVGIPGVGKTTLTKHVFDKVHDDFVYHAVIRVSQRYTVEGLLRDMIRKLCRERKKDPPSNISEIDRGSLEEELRNRLHKKSKVKNTCFGEYIGGGHDQSESSGLVRRLTIATNDVTRSTQTSLIRSIIINIPEKQVPIKKEIPGKQEESWFVRLERKILKDNMPLKVLDFEDSGLPRVPKKLGKLIHLRYLSFRGTPIESLPKSIGKLLSLETLDIRETKVCKIPKEITKLRKLRHLLTPNCASSSIEWKDIGGMTMLQKIPQVRMEFDEVAIREVGKLKQLRDLRVLCFSGEHNNVLCSSIEKMEHLQALRIETSGHHRSEVVDLNNITLPNSKPIKKLFLDMKLESLPNWIPELSQTLHFQRGGFPKLRKLILSNLCNLNSIRIDDTALQSLEYFELTCLDELKTIPEGIQYLQKLKFLNVPSMPFEFVEEIHRIGKDKHWTINYGCM
ncbi:hypothetical protein VNO80_30176 [Phaseolus coccineus]|uniref:NB-ARC domain-containing protein n=1 Tax=Phaseolus coccineus TaxID=3886 RepID=A0AAN9QFK9_PHACN